jgi:hypothetical protein
VPIGPVPAAEPAQFQGGHRVHHDEHQIASGSQSRMSTGISNG